MGRRAEWSAIKGAYMCVYIYICRYVSLFRGFRVYRTQGFVLLVWG